MASRTVCLYKGKYIGIETIYTICDGKQINIPEKLKALRMKSKNKELFCPCGCGANLILVAGENMLREQHFRIKNRASNKKCHAVMEGSHSLISKIVIKCWLDDKLNDEYLESRVPISCVDETDRRYEFTFLSKQKNLGLVYFNEKVNVIAEKLDILKDNSRGIKIIHMIDSSNAGTIGQYPEKLMEMQNRQGYCLYLNVSNMEYNHALLKATIFVQELSGIWKEIVLVDGLLSDYDIDNNGELYYKGNSLLDFVSSAKVNYEEEKRRLLEEEKQRQLEKEDRKREELKRKEQLKSLFQEVKSKTATRGDGEKGGSKVDKDAIRKELSLYQFSKNQKAYDQSGKRWFKCEYCGKIDIESEFYQYTGSLGICRTCDSNNLILQQKRKEESSRLTRNLVEKNDKKNRFPTCPKCGSKLVEKEDTYGKFLKCSNTIRCFYKVRKSNGSYFY